MGKETGKPLTFFMIKADTHRPLTSRTARITSREL